jgi:uncharacterized protein (TIGR03083 family)
MIRHPTAGMDEDAVWAASTANDSTWPIYSRTSPTRSGHIPRCAQGGGSATSQLTSRSPTPAAHIGILRAGGSFDRMIRDTARRHATVPTKQVIAEIRAMGGSRRRAPGVTHLEPLLDILVHGQDIAIPLGRPRTMPVDAAATAATRVWTMGWPFSTAFRARTRLRGLELVATDTDWSVGEGAQVEGPVEALLLLLTGRTASVSRLSGTGVGQLAPAVR